MKLIEEFAINKDGKLVKIYSLVDTTTGEIRFGGVKKI